MNYSFILGSGMFGHPCSMWLVCMFFIFVSLVLLLNWILWLSLEDGFTGVPHRKLKTFSGVLGCLALYVLLIYINSKYNEVVFSVSQIPKDPETVTDNWRIETDSDGNTYVYY